MKLEVLSRDRTSWRTRTARQVGGENLNGLLKQKRAFNGRRESWPRPKLRIQGLNGRTRRVPLRQELAPIAKNGAAENKFPTKKSRAVSRSHFLEDLVLGLRDLGAFQFGNFTLASGRHSSLYVDLRLLVSRPCLMQIAAEAYVSVLRTLHCDRVAGIPYAALPIGAAVSLASDIPLIYNRKEGKQHGLARVMEGIWKQGERIVIIEDVITTGGSIINSVELFRKVGLEVKDAVVLLDRQQGGVENLRMHGVSVHSILGLQEVLEFLDASGNCGERAIPKEVRSEQPVVSESASSL